MLATHGRFGYSPITDRPDFEWPGGRRLAVYIAICVEHFSYDDGGLGLSYSPGIPHPNTYNWAWREYGNRVGGWRLHEVMQQNELAPTVLVNSSCYDHCPELLDAYAEIGTEFVGHGRSNSELQNGLDEADERELIVEVRDRIASGSSTPPAGWMSPGANPSRATEDILAEEGFTYTLDWPLDDQPTWLSTRGGPLLSVPYPHEVNDVPMIALHHGSASGFAEVIVDNFDELLAQSRSQALVYGIVLHTFIVGQPFRLRRFREALEHILSSRDELWLTTPGEIAEFWRDRVQAPGDVKPTTA
ncbi:MAG: polysaccharide deacetylase family protein [Gaiellaceae bacterium]